MELRWRPDFNPFQPESVETQRISNYFYGNLYGNPLGKSYFSFPNSKWKLSILLAKRIEPPQVSTLTWSTIIVRGQPAGSRRELLVPDLTRTQTLSFVLSEPSPFVIEANAAFQALLRLRIRSRLIPVIITASNDANQLSN